MAMEQSSQTTDSSAVESIVVALDASPNSVAALRAAAEMAAWLGVPLEGLFIEDINLTRICELPNQFEVGSYTGAVRRLDNRTMQRQLRALASAIRQAMAREATRHMVTWTFHVRRGPVVTELLAATQSASVVSVGRTGRGHRRDLGSTAESIVRESTRPVLVTDEDGRIRSPFTVLFTGTEASERALRFAARLAQSQHDSERSKLRVVVWVSEDGPKKAEMSRRVEAILGPAADRAFLIEAVTRDFRPMLTLEKGTLVLARENASLLSEHSGPVILVP